MTRIMRAWGALAPEQRLAVVTAIALLVTMFFPWYDLQSLNPKTHLINSHSISAFGDVSFVEAAVFLVAAGVIALMFARAERRDFHMPGSDGAVVMIAGGWATILIFYRVFSRPAGHGYPVGIEWGFLLAFLAAGVLTFAGWRMRATSTPEAPLIRGRGRRAPAERPLSGEDLTVLAPAPQHPERTAPVAAHSAQPPASTPQSSPSTQSSPPSSPPTPAPRAPRSTPLTSRKRPRFPPAPSDQLSFEDPPAERDER